MDTLATQHATEITSPLTTAYVPHIDVMHGDCLDILRTMPDNSIDAVVTDPPYGLSQNTPEQVAVTIGKWGAGERDATPVGRGFMGKSWDSFVPPPAVWDECLRVLKPGGHMAVFAGARTQDLMGLSIRLAGFEIRDTLGWVYGSGFPKSHDIGKAIDKRGGNAQAARWDGWGTALKPAIEPIILARKPLDGTVASNVLEHGVGGLNIDACRVSVPEDDDIHAKNPHTKGGFGHSGAEVYGKSAGAEAYDPSAGRFPANVLLDEHAAAEMDKQSGITKDGVAVRHRGVKGGEIGPPGNKPEGTADMGYGGGGGASRFFPVFKYQAKAPKRERPVIEREDGSKTQHPTVKPVALMEWLVSLIVPPGGTVLDPFAGTGTTLEAARNKDFNAIGIEREADYIQLIEKRLGKEPSSAASTLFDMRE